MKLINKIEHYKIWDIYGKSLQYYRFFDFDIIVETDDMFFVTIDVWHPERRCFVEAKECVNKNRVLKYTYPESGNSIYWVRNQ
jgi:hypothetical protein